MADSLLDDVKPEGDEGAGDSGEGQKTPPSSDERPDWLPEKYKTGEDLAKAYKALESKLGTKEEDLRKAIRDEITAESLSKRPKAAGDYQLPESIDADAAVDNEMLKWWSEHSFEKGYDQDTFAKGIEMYAAAAANAAPKVDLEAESKRLGDNANQRIEAASLFARKMFPEEQMGAIKSLFGTADGILVMETIMEAMKDGSSFKGAAETGMTEEQLTEMMKDERYWSPQKRDNDFVKKVQDGFNRLYG